MSAHDRVISVSQEGNSASTLLHHSLGLWLNLQTFLSYPVPKVMKTILKLEWLGNIFGLSGCSGWYLDREIIKGRTEFQDFCGRHEANRRATWPQISPGGGQGRGKDREDGSKGKEQFWCWGFALSPVIQDMLPCLFSQSIFQEPGYSQSPFSSSSVSTTPPKMILKDNLCQSALFHFIFSLKGGHHYNYGWLTDFVFCTLINARPHFILIKTTIQCV